MDCYGIILVDGKNFSPEGAKTKANPWFSHSRPPASRPADLARPAPEGSAAVGGIMLPRRHRLARREAEKVIKSGRLFFTSRLSLRVLTFPPAGKSLAPSRFTVVVSGRHIKKAAERNLLKRRLRRIVGSLLPKVKSSRGAAIFTSRLPAGYPFNLLAEEVAELFKRARMV